MNVLPKEFYSYHFFCHIAAKSWLARCNWWREAGVPAENHRLTPSHWQLSHLPRPRFGPRQWWETAGQVSGNAKDIVQGGSPIFLCLWLIEGSELLYSLTEIPSTTVVHMIPLGLLGFASYNLGCITHIAASSGSFFLNLKWGWTVIIIYLLFLSLHTPMLTIPVLLYYIVN